MSGGTVRMLLLAGIAAVALTGCELKDNGDNLVNGKTLFVDKCSQCHTLARANARGTVGPNLDQAWQRALSEGFRRSTYKGVVHRQILYPARDPQVDPETGKPGPLMPADLVSGENAQDVAAYVASVAAAPGKDQGRLAAVGAQAQGTAKAQGGKLEIPVGTGLSYKYKDAQAPAGKVEVDSVNDQTTDHNIAIEGNGVDEVGNIVNGGGTSTVNVDLKPGDYFFYCSVDGHRQGGMEGKLTVK